MFFVCHVSVDLAHVVYCSEDLSHLVMGLLVVKMWGIVLNLDFLFLLEDV